MSFGSAFPALSGVAAVFCSILNAQSTDVKDLAAGKVLVMQQPALDPAFAESVILLIQYGADGVVGLMLNRPADVPLSRLRDLPGTSNRSDPIYVGGPVETDQVTALVRAPKAPPEGIHVAANVYAVVTRGGLEAALKASKGPDDLRIFLGYCGWNIPQLQNEMKYNGWYIFDHGERFALDSTPRTLWKRLTEQTGLRVEFAPATLAAIFPARRRYRSGSAE